MGVKGFKRLAPVPLLALMIACAQGTARDAGESAFAYPEVVYFNGNIVTVDARFSIADSMAVRNGRFVGVGTREAVTAMAGPETQQVDLQGRTVLPGFNDAHMDLVQRAGEFMLQVDLTEVDSIAAIQQAIAARAAEEPPGTWILGSRGWWVYGLTERREPTRYDLDEAALEHPVCIPGPHYSICNSLALRIGGVTRNTEDPPGGEIWRDESGEPSGLLMENARRFVRPYFPEATRAQMLDGIRHLIEHMNRHGMTSYREPGGRLEDVELMQELHAAGELTIRVDWAYHVDPLTPLDQIDDVLRALGPPGQRFGDGMFRADGLAELGLDGAEQNALLRRDYPDRPGYRGDRLVPVEQFRGIALAAARHGWRLGPHMVGDAAIDQAISAYEYVNSQVDITGRRWMLDHAFLIMPDHYQKIHDLGLVVSSQIMHNFQLGQAILNAWGRPLADKSERYRDWVDNGIILAGGSDGPVSYYTQPILYIYASVTRNTDWGGTLGAEQGLTREQAIRTVTINPAYMSFEENVKGSIEPDKYADFVVLSDDILTVPAGQIRNIEVLATALAGRVIYGSVR